MMAHMKWIYSKSDDNNYRYSLGVEGNNPLICFGINPSTAEPNTLDPTLKRVSKYADCHGFDSWIMFNLYPQRATKPDHLHSHISNEHHEKNLEEIAKHITRDAQLIWAAWGNVITIKPYLSDCLQDINELIISKSGTWTCLDTTSNGNPVHPLCRKKGFKLYTTPLKPYIIK